MVLLSIKLTEVHINIIRTDTWPYTILKIYIKNLKKLKEVTRPSLIANQGCPKPPPLAIWAWLSYL